MVFFAFMHILVVFFGFLDTVVVLRLKFCILAAALVDTVAACDAVDTVAVAACDGALMVMGRPGRLPTMPQSFF